MTATSSSQDSVQKSSLAYILSASHSGSTLLAMLLGSQPGACTVGELRAPRMGDANAYSCSCGKKIKECAFWSKVSDAMEKKGIAGFDITAAGTSIFDVNSKYISSLLDPLPQGPLLEVIRECGLRFSPKWAHHLQKTQSRNAALIAVLKELTDSKLVVDSSKAVLHLKYLLKNPVLDIKVIRLIRDGRAVALSLIGHGIYPRKTRRETVATAAREWRRSNEAAECLLGGVPGSQQTQIKYEDICSDPSAALKNLCAFLGLDSQNVTLDFRSRMQHVLGNEMRLKSTSAIRLDERWRTELSQDDLRVFDTVAGKLNQKYGYG